MAAGSRLAHLALLALLALVALAAGTHVFTLERDFGRLQADRELALHVQEVVSRLKTFKVPVHPRIRLFYRLLKKAMADYARRTSDSLYDPATYGRRRDDRHT